MELVDTTFDKIKQWVDHQQVASNCYSTTIDFISEFTTLKDPSFSKAVREILGSDEFDLEHLSNKEYAEWTVSIIEWCLNKRRFIGVYIREVNDYGNLSHVFTLVKLTTGIYRVESYINQYSPRIVSFDNYKEKLYELLSASQGRELLWNQLFSCKDSDTGRVFKVKLM